ncbi:flagellar protein FliS [Acidocella sp.]|uniref:flagellar protein FliS n=1 Tax=Acidocella sp. TaxID=50710 RepID=UPI00260E78CB|nr:flagellar protein FliS [Acidocella sp.]
MNDISANLIMSYRASMFDGPADILWLRQGWRGLRQYGRRAKAAIAAGDVGRKAEMIAKADELLTFMVGIIDTSEGVTLGNALMTIYSALRFTLLRANLDNDSAALDDFEAALMILDQDMKMGVEGAPVA